MTTTVIRTGAPTALEGLREDLVQAFRQARDAVGAGNGVVFVVAAADLMGHRGPERAALSGAVVGMARAIAFEGARPGWQANVLAVPDDVDLTDADAAQHFNPGVSGQVVTVGTSLVGKVAP